MDRDRTRTTAHDGTDSARMSVDERHRWLVDYNATDATWPDGDFVSLVRAHALADPDVDAVVDGELRRSRGELDRRAARLADILRRAGARRGARVGLLCPRSIEFVESVVGILRTGAAVVPLDPINPDERLRLMVEDAQPVVVLHTPQLADRLPDGVAGIALDDARIDDARFDDVDADGPIAVWGDDDVTHLIYTSGSTGRPKAVLERHEAIVNLVHWTGRAYGVRAGDRAAWMSTPGFAVQLMEWMPYLGLGVAVHIGESRDRTPEQVRDWLLAERITHAMLVAGMAERVWPLDWPDDTALRILVTTAERVHSWPSLDTPFQVVMTYGSTETTNVLSCLDIGAGIDLTSQNTPADVRAAHPVPVGRPIANLRVYILDEHDDPVAPGDVGRLHVAGAGLGAGYHDAPDMTDRKFRKNPLPEEPSSVLYDTGDLARFRSDGAIELLGRSDAQVKIRGHRVELGEVETIVAAAPGVEEAAVVAYEAGPGDMRLHAYVSPASASAADVRATVAAALPSYMVPSQTVVLDGLPRLPNGKVDLQALPEPSTADRSSLSVDFTAPRDEREAELARLWESLFGTEPIGVHDNFFELGGHSLLAFQLVNSVREHLEVDIGLPDLNRAPTIAELAPLIATRRSRGTSEFADMEPIVADLDGRHEPFPLTDSQQALWIGRGDAVDLGNVGCHGYFEWESDHLDVDRFCRAWRRLVDRHDALRTITRPDGKQQVLVDPPDYDIEVLDVRDQTDKVVAAKLEELRDFLSHRVMDDGDWPLFDVRLSLLPPIGSGRYRVRIHLSLDMLIADAWSYFQVLVPDLVQLYEDDAPLPPLRVQFRDYVLGVRERLFDSEAYRRSERYWQPRLDSLPPAPQLPERPATQERLPIRFDRRAHVLDVDEWSLLKRRAIAIGVTPSGLMTSVFAEVLRAWTKQPHFTINFPIFNRIPLHDDVNRLIGDTTTTLLLPVEKADGTFAERAQAMQEELWNALEHRFYTGVQILRELTRRRGTMMPAMPIVLTSLLGHPPRRYMTSLGEQIYSISQTPQVSLDFQIFELEGRLDFNWDFLPGVFPDGYVEGMFDAYCAILHALIDREDAWDEPRFAAVEAADAVAPGPDEMARQYADVAARMLDTALPVVDLMCGDGSRTRALAARFPIAVGAAATAAAASAAAGRLDRPGRARFDVLAPDDADAAAALGDEIGDAHVVLVPGGGDADASPPERTVRAVAGLAGRRGRCLLVTDPTEHARWVAAFTDRGWSVEDDVDVEPGAIGALLRPRGRR